MLTETPRLLVRPFRETDEEALHAILSDPEVMRWIEAPFSLERTQSFLREAGLCRPPWVFAVIRKADGELIGQLIWHPWGTDAMELGWILRRDAWGMGLAGELTEAMFARTDRDVVIECCPGQKATEHIAEENGFEREDDRDGLAVFRRRR